MTKILTVKEIEERLRRMSITMKLTNEVQQMASVETSEMRRVGPTSEMRRVGPTQTSEMRRVGPTPISPFGVGQGEHISVEVKRENRPTSNFTRWRGAV